MKTGTNKSEERYALTLRDPSQENCPSEVEVVDPEIVISHCGSRQEAADHGFTRAGADPFQECLKVRGTFGMYRALHIRALDEPVINEAQSAMFGPDSSHSQSAPLQRLSWMNSGRLAAMYQEEFEALNAAKGDVARYVGIALSGGGIRSASFSTGVLLSLHDLGMLEHVGYLSTVSGGGYAGAWLMMHPSLTTDTLLQPGGRDLHHLSQYGSYLTNRNSSQTMSGLVGTLAVQVLFLPLQWLSNGVFDLNFNVPILRTSYRQGIAAAFEYKSALAPSDPSSDADKIQGMGSYKPDRSHPLWIINMHLALNDDDSFYKARTGDAVEVTPFRAGGDAVGYITVRPEICWTCDDYWTSPYYAVAASAAAIDGKSGQQGLLASAGLWLLNMNLGYNVNSWASRFTSGSSWWRNLRYYVMSPFPLYLLTDLHRQRASAKSLLLTDGGHFDNIGLYALIRRGVRFIVVVDGTQDQRIDQWCSAHRTGDYSTLAAAFDDLHVTEERLYSDFGVTIEWQWAEICSGRTQGFRDVVPTHVFTGRIRGLPIPNAANGVATDAFIVYVKAAYTDQDGMLKASSFIDANKVADPDFPDNSTGDQFYTERQILSYRELGRRMIEAGSHGAQAIAEGIRKLCSELDPAHVETCERKIWPR